MEEININIDYTKYTYKNLLYCLNNIDKEKYPDNYKLLIDEIELRKSKNENVIPIEENIDYSLKYKSKYIEVKYKGYLSIINKLPIILILLCLSIMFFMNYNGEHKLVNDNLLLTVLIILLVLTGISGFLSIIIDRKCPNCNKKMEKIGPSGDNGSTYIFVCHECKIYINTHLNGKCGE